MSDKSSPMSEYYGKNTDDTPSVSATSPNQVMEKCSGSSVSDGTSSVGGGRGRRNVLPLPVAGCNAITGMCSLVPGITAVLSKVSSCSKESGDISPVGGTSSTVDSVVVLVRPDTLPARYHLTSFPVKCAPLVKLAQTCILINLVLASKVLILSFRLLLTLRKTQLLDPRVTVVLRTTDSKTLSLLLLLLSVSSGLKLPTRCGRVLMIPVGTHGGPEMTILNDVGLVLV